jgi:hypothetical protein
MKKVIKKLKKRNWDAFAIVMDGHTYQSIGGDGFQLEDEMYRLRGKYPDRKFEIISVVIKEK